MLWENPKQRPAGRKLPDPKKKIDGLGRATGAAHQQRDASAASEEQQTGPTLSPACFKSVYWMRVRGAISCFQFGWKSEAKLEVADSSCFKRKPANSWESQGRPAAEGCWVRLAKPALTASWGRPAAERHQGKRA